jgi:hypothetical protein
MQPDSARQGHRRAVAALVSLGHSCPGPGAVVLDMGRSLPVVWPHEIPDSGISHRNTGQARVLASGQVMFPRFSRHLNTLREISPLWGRIPCLKVQVPPRTPKPGNFPKQDNARTRSPAACWPAGPSGPSPRGGSHDRPAHRSPHSPAYPGRAAGSTAGRARPAAPEVPAVPDDVLYGFGRMDESGRVADRAMTSALGWQPGDRLTLTVAAGVVIARRDLGGMVTCRPSRTW